MTSPSRSSGSGASAIGMSPWQAAVNDPNAKHRPRRLAALLVAPCVPAALACIAAMVMGSPAVIPTIGTYLVTAAIGIPTYLIARKFEIEALRGYVIVGTLVGMTAWALIFIPAAIMRWRTTVMPGSQLLKSTLTAAIAAFVCFSLASAVFWLIAIRRRAND
jgi:hypothetical protein